VNVEELLPAYVTGELDEADRERVRAALAASPALREELARYEGLLLLLTIAAAEDLQAPGDLSTRIMRQVTLHFYLNRLTNLVHDLVGAYGRAIAFYLGLT
jgi:anti-sigma factor RsiW